MKRAHDTIISAPEAGSPTPDHVLLQVCDPTGTVLGDLYFDDAGMWWIRDAVDGHEDNKRGESILDFPFELAWWLKIGYTFKYLEDTRHDGMSTSGVDSTTTSV